MSYNNMIIQNTSIELTTEFHKMIDDALTQRIGFMFDEAVKEIQEKKNEFISGILLSIQKQVDIQQIGERTIFTIREISK